MSSVFTGNQVDSMALFFLSTVFVKLCTCCLLLPLQKHQASALITDPIKQATAPTQGLLPINFLLAICIQN